jgi:hypothetical protein
MHGQVTICNLGRNVEVLTVKAKEILHWFSKVMIRKFISNNIPIILSQISILFIGRFNADRNTQVAHIEDNVDLNAG